MSHATHGGLTQRQKIIVSLLSVCALVGIFYLGNAYMGYKLDTEYQQAVSANRAQVKKARNILQESRIFAHLKDSDVKKEDVSSLHTLNMSVKSLEKDILTSTTLHDHKGYRRTFIPWEAPHTNIQLWKDNTHDIRNSTQAVIKELYKVKSSYDKVESEKAYKVFTSAYDTAASLSSQSHGRVMDNSTIDTLNATLQRYASYKDKGTLPASSLTYASNLINSQSQDVQSSATAWDNEQQRITQEQVQQAQQHNTSRARGSSGYVSRSYTGVTYRSGSNNSHGSAYGVSDYCEATATYTCQDVIDRGGISQLGYHTTGYNTTIYAQHAKNGGGWVDKLQQGQTVTIGGKNYTVGSRAYNQTYAPTSGTYAQTCTNNGIVLVQLTPQG